MRPLPIALVASLSLAPVAGATTPVTYPSTAVIAANLTPAVNAWLARSNFTQFRFGRTVCVREATPGQYICAAAHIQAGAPIGNVRDVWHVIVTRTRTGFGWSVDRNTGPICPVPGAVCVQTDPTQLTPG